MHFGKNERKYYIFNQDLAFLQTRNSGGGGGGVLVLFQKL